MSGGLLLKVSVVLRGEDLADGTSVLANVYPTTRAQEGARNILIPAGDGVAPRRVEVDAGRYVVEAVMPSGKLLSEEATVVEGQDVEVNIEDYGSPHESHGWQYFSGNIEPDSVYSSSTTVPLSRSTSSRYAELLGADFSTEPEPWTGPVGGKVPDVRWLPDARPKGLSFETLNELSVSMKVADPHGLSTIAGDNDIVPIQGPTESDGISHLYRFDRNGPVPPLGAPAIPTIPMGQRRFAVVHAPPDVFLVTLPIPWEDVQGNDVQVELMYNARQTPTGSPVAVTVRDRSIGTGLGYLAGGALSAAARVFQDVEGMLYGKVLNPLAAAAGAYVLVGIESDPKSKPWHGWLGNLRDWFPWMSDGALLWSVHALRYATNDEEVRAARDGLVEAYRRGVPFLTLGLSWLIDGLSNFPEDDECQTALSEVRRLCWRVDLRQPFVVLRLNRRQG